MRAGLNGSGRQARGLLWPSTREQWLVRAVLGADDVVVDAWRAWHADADYDDLAPAEHRLLPLLLERLRRLGVDDPILEHYHGVFRFFWFRNRVLLRQAARVCRDLEAAGIPVLVLKGVPLSLAYYEHTGHRPMNDVDILVRQADAVRAIERLLDEGWVCANPSLRSLDHPDRVVRVRHGLNFRSSTGGQIDLHWAVSRGCLRDTGELWAHAQTVTCGEDRFRTLDSGGHLLVALDQAAEWDGMSPLRWLIDAFRILRRGDMDWPRFTSAVQCFDQAAAARGGLAVLRDLLGVKVPLDVMTAIDAIRPPLATRLDCRLCSRPPLPLVGKVLRRYLRCARTRPQHGLSFGRYLAYFWGLPDRRAVLAAGVGTFAMDRARAAAHRQRVSRALAARSSISRKRSRTASRE